MRSLLVAVCILLALVMVPELVQSATCPDICSTKSLWGFGGESVGNALCECTNPLTGDAARTGPNCGCGVCYVRQNGIIVGYAKVNGVCPAGQTDCTDCGLSASSSGSGSKATNTTTAPTSAPTSSSSQSGSGNQAGADAGDSNEMKTWQIALIICSCVLVFGVVTMTIMSCYCKTRKQMKDNNTLEDETREYENYWHPGASTGEARAVHDRYGNTMNNSAISAQLTQGGRSSFTSSHSRPNSTKNVPFSEPTFSENDKMGSGVGRASGRQSLGSRNDLPHVFNAFPQRPTHELDNRKNIAIEL